jgi:hypothetical protein
VHGSPPLVEATAGEGIARGAKVFGFAVEVIRFTTKLFCPSSVRGPLGFLGGSPRRLGGGAKKLRGEDENLCGGSRKLRGLSKMICGSSELLRGGTNELRCRGRNRVGAAKTVGNRAN